MYVGDEVVEGGYEIREEDEAAVPRSFDPKFCRPRHSLGLFIFVVFILVVGQYWGPSN
jgi:hypothetical protein